MNVAPFAPTRWTDRLAFDIALTLEGSGEPMTDLMSRHSLSSSDMATLQSDPVFLGRVKQYREEIREKGMTFRLKAQAQAEELLTTSWLLIHDGEVSPAVKADLIKNTVRWAGYDKTAELEAAAAGSGVRITINLGDKTPTTHVVDGAVRELPDKP